MSNSPVQAVLFDLDGTLVDTAPDFLWALNTIQAERNLPALTEQQMRRSVSNGSIGLVEGALGIPQISHEFEQTRQRLLSLYLEIIGRYAALYPGLDCLLEFFTERGIAWGISTNKPSLYTHALLDVMQLAPPPATVVCPDQVANPKPHPEPLLLNAKHLGLQPNQIVFVGDHIRDIQAGRRAGMRTVAAAWGYIDSIEETQEWGATAICTQSEKLQYLLEDWI
jgi:phosphoglycolate phosphatase